MDCIRIQELKSQIGQIVKRLGEGEEFLLTSRGKPVGRLSPMKKRSRAEIFAEMEKLRERQPAVTADEIARLRRDGAK